MWGFLAWLWTGLLSVRSHWGVRACYRESHHISWPVLLTVRVTFDSAVFIEDSTYHLGFLHLRGIHRTDISNASCFWNTLTLTLNNGTDDGLWDEFSIWRIGYASKPDFCAGASLIPLGLVHLYESSPGHVDLIMRWDNTCDFICICAGSRVGNPNYGKNSRAAHNNVLMQMKLRNVKIAGAPGWRRR